MSSLERGATGLRGAFRQVYKFVLNRPFLSEKQNNGDSQKTLFSAVRYA